MTTSAPTSIGNKTTKVKRLEEDGFCVLCFLFFFCCESFFYVFVKLKFIFYHEESSHYLQIKHNTKFLLQRVKLHHNFGFFWFLSQS
jgi:hypothetical protein